jgi:hypothetical protein
MKTVSTIKETLSNLFKDIKGYSFIGLKSETIPKIFKKGNEYSERPIKKLSDRVYLIGDKAYERLVRNARKKYNKEVKEGIFEASERVWGESEGTSGSVISKGEELYLQVYPINKIKGTSKFIFADTGEEFNPFDSKYQEFVLSTYKAEKISYSKSQNLFEDEIVRVNAFKFTSLKEIRYNKEVYKIA